MILLDTDVMVDLLRQYPPAMRWFNSLDEGEEIAVPGFVVMELVQGCRSKQEQRRLLQVLVPYAIVWLDPGECENALRTFIRFHLSHHIGLLDVLVAQTAIALDVPLCTFNQKHYRCIRQLQTLQPYEKLHEAAE
ncbi:MAG: PIN domain-containing protein [Armatimonadota bacterium]|nr:PIN domain-containing protein [bacterium]MDW8321503.1 PIN domain-containing protein [Armatimonadota bacterium]